MFIKKEDVEFGKSKIENAEKLKSYIRSNIPLTDFMDFNIDELTDFSIKVSVPIKPNGNHYNTAFGGSIATLGILCGWALLHSKMLEEKVSGTIVIKQSTTKYIAPARTDFEAACTDLTKESWENFKTELSQNEKSTLTLHSILSSDGNLIAKQESVYVGLAKSR
ncbi:MAG: hypothetical protein A2068_05510 [Ignavibacteria bacterium GWB2_35_6b]|nr:MAG: hypothetical protein A2068_05510 [Ignavibacteria bacterium GWB2_35_6b]